jgi:hypothetical protein
MTRVLRRPMFRMGGNTDQGIMSGVVPRPGYQYGELVKQLPELQKIAKEYAYKPKSYTPAQGLIDFGLNVASAPGGGSIFATAAESAKKPFEKYTTGKAEADLQKYVSEADMFKSLIEAQGEIMGGEGSAKWQKQWEAEQIPGLVNRISELEGRDDLSNEEKNELRSKRILLDKYSPEDEFTKFFLAQPKIGLGLFKKIKADLITQDQQAATPRYDPELGEDDPKLITDSFREFRRQVREMRATGGRVGYQEAGPVMGQPTQADAMPEELGGVSYEELRARLPQDVSDEVVRLLANSPEALEDFAVIQTEQDIANFNKKYGVNLVLPAEA